MIPTVPYQIYSCFVYSEYVPANYLFHHQNTPDVISITGIPECNTFYNKIILQDQVLMATLFGGIMAFTIFEMIFSIIILRMFLSKVLLLTLQCNQTKMKIELSASRSRSKSKSNNGKGNGASDTTEQFLKLAIKTTNVIILAVVSNFLSLIIFSFQWPTYVCLCSISCTIYI